MPDIVGSSEIDHTLFILDPTSQKDRKGRIEADREICFEACKEGLQYGLIECR
jgi:hypothetical protein